MSGLQSPLPRQGIGIGASIGTSTSMSMQGRIVALSVHNDGRSRASIARVGADIASGTRTTT